MNPDLRGIRSTFWSKSSSPSGTCFLQFFRYSLCSWADRAALLFGGPGLYRRGMDSCFDIGGVRIAGRVLNAPMTGVTDLPCRRAASRLGAPYVATEMVACDAFARGRPDVV